MSQVTLTATRDVCLCLLIQSSRSSEERKKERTDNRSLKEKEPSNSLKKKHSTIPHKTVLMSVVNAAYSMYCTKSTEEVRTSSSSSSSWWWSKTTPQCKALYASSDKMHQLHRHQCQHHGTIAPRNYGIMPWYHCHHVRVILQMLQYCMSAK